MTWYKYYSLLLTLRWVAWLQIAASPIYDMSNARICGRFDEHELYFRVEMDSQIVDSISGWVIHRKSRFYFWLSLLGDSLTR